MAASDILKKDIDECESTIEDILLKVEITSFYQKQVSEFKKSYEKIKSVYYDKKLADYTSIRVNKLSLTSLSFDAQYCISLENDFLPFIKDLYNLAICRQTAEEMVKKDVVVTSDIYKILDTYLEIFNNEPFEKEKDELYTYLISFFYNMIKKDAIDNGRFNIIDILNSYQKKGISIIKGVTRLYLKEVNDIYKNKKTKETISLVKQAISDDFNKEDIIALLNYIGIKIDNVNSASTEYKQEKKYESIPYTNRIRLWRDTSMVEANKFGLKKDVLYPKDAKHNAELRKYDLTYLDYLTSNSLKNVDLSYTNAIILPTRRYDSSLEGTNLEGVDMRGVDLTDVNIEGANLEKTGADITGSHGTCLGISPYEEEKILVSKDKITVTEFEKITMQNACPIIYKYYENGNPLDFTNMVPCTNRILRQYDISCIEYHFEDFIRECNYASKWTGDNTKRGLDFSYTNIDFNPQEFTEEIVMNLEGVDLRNKDFTGVEKYFAHCNLKGTGANISPVINPTVSPYVEGKTVRKGK